MRKDHPSKSSPVISSMYPRVKVREQDDSASKIMGGRSLPLGIFESLTLEDSKRCFPGISFPVSENDGQRNSPPSLARVPQSYAPIIPRPSVSVSKGKCNREIDVESRPYIRAGLMPRPRAVLSSPNNDGKLRTDNQASRTKDPISKRNGDQASRSKEPISKKQNPCQNVHVPTKVNAKNAKVNSPVKARKAIEEAHNKIHCQEKQGPGASKQKVYITKTKTTAVGINI